MTDSGAGDNSLEDLRKATESGSKIDETEPDREFVETLVEALSQTDTARSNLNLTVNDPELWALFQALESDSERYREFREALDLDPESGSREPVLRALLRIGVVNADPELAEEMRAALAERASEGF